MMYWVFLVCTMVSIVQEAIHAFFSSVLQVILLVSGKKSRKKYRMRTRARKTRDNEKRSFNFISLSAKANARQKKVSLK